MAATSLEEILLFYRGTILHPDHPLPAEELKQVEIQWHNGYEADTITGQIYTDGACKPHKIRELSRAAAGVVTLNEEGQKMATISALVPRHPPRTAPSAEFYAAQIASGKLTPPATMHTDCLNVYKAAKALPQRYSGAMQIGSSFVVR